MLLIDVNYYIITGTAFLNVEHNIGRRTIMQSNVITVQSVDRA